MQIQAEPIVISLFKDRPKFIVHCSFLI
jgi:hypothetical protein